MVGQGIKFNGGGVVHVESNDEAVNGSSLESENGGFRTYKRRKHTKSNCFEANLVENGKGFLYSNSQSTDKTMQEPSDTASCEQDSPVRMVSNASANGSGDHLHKDWRSIVMEEIFQSLDVTEGGLQDCVRDAILFLANGGCKTAVKEFGEYKHMCPAEMQLMFNGFPKGNGPVSLNGSMDESKRTTNELCHHALFAVIISEKFAQLCNLLCENFQGMKVDNFFNLCHIDSRMKEGVYGSSPMLFHSDIQQVWSKLQKVGNEMVALAESLSDKSRSCCKQVGGSFDGTSDDGKNQLITKERNLLTKPEQTEPCGVYSISTCQRCGEKADGRDFLACDSCEEMCHVSCIEPAVEEIPQKSWYCAKCTLKGIESPHDDCVVCTRLNAPTSRINEDDLIKPNEEDLELEKISDGLVEDGLDSLKEGKHLPCCKICGSDIVYGEKLVVCGHTFCPHKYYHMRCLTAKLLNSYGPCWYCPSCLCRVCLTDQDDDEIVLCDCCDQAYHIYCLQPPRTSIPRGKWFCRKCDPEIRCIKKAKRAYESKIKRKKQEQEGKGKYGDLKDVSKDMSEEALNQSGGVDMLLSAAKTLNF